MIPSAGSRATRKNLLEFANLWHRSQSVRARSLVNGQAPDFSVGQLWLANVNGSTFSVPNPIKPPPVPIDPRARCFVGFVITFASANSWAMGTKFKGMAGYTASTTGVDCLTFLYDPTTDLYGLWGFNKAIFT